MTIQYKHAMGEHWLCALIIINWEIKKKKDLKLKTDT